MKMKSFNRSAITIFGTDEFLLWVKDSHPELQRWDLKSLNHQANVYLVSMEDQNATGACFEDNFKEIFKNEVGEYIYDGVSWPAITLDLFKRWFTFEYHEQAYDLSSKELKVFEE
jgi:hypothetical protein